MSPSRLVLLCGVSLLCVCGRADAQETPPAPIIDIDTDVAPIRRKRSGRKVASVLESLLPRREMARAKDAPSSTVEVLPPGKAAPLTGPTAAQRPNAMKGTSAGEIKKPSDQVRMEGGSSKAPMLIDLPASPPRMPTLGRIQSQMQQQEKNEQSRWDSIQRNLDKLEEAIRHPLESPPAKPVEPPVMEPAPSVEVEPVAPDALPTMPAAPPETPIDPSEFPTMPSPAPPLPAPPLPAPSMPAPSIEMEQFSPQNISPQDIDPAAPKPAPAMVEPSPKPEPMTPAPAPTEDVASPPTGMIATSEAVDRVSLADSLYAAGNLGVALKIYEEMAPDEQGDQRVWVDFQIGNAYRRLNQIENAESSYRAVASQPGPAWIVESARWWLATLEQRKNFEGDVADLKQALETLQQSK